MKDIYSMSSYGDERVAAKRALTKQIRARSSEMERNVAKFLLGRRVPMSGAGYMKGDCEVETDKVGRIFIECKYSASRHTYKGPRIRLDYRWFDKMHGDAVKMKAKFAALVFRYHDVRFSNYVIISTDVLERYDTSDKLTGAAIIDTGGHNGVTLFKSAIDTAFASHARAYNVAILQCIKGRYALMTLDLFKELIHDESTTDTL